MNLPPRPPCFPSTGELHCPCQRQNTAQALACIAARYLWIAGKTVADMATDADRKHYLGLVARSKGTATAERIRAAAKELIAEREKGGLFA